MFRFEALYKPEIYDEHIIGVMDVRRAETSMKLVVELKS